MFKLVFLYNFNLFDERLDQPSQRRIAVTFSLDLRNDGVTTDQR